MLDKAQACRILEIPEDATRKQIEDKYYLLVKRSKSKDGTNFSKINEAYRFLSGYTPLQAVKFKELKWREKLQHIREYYIMEIVFSFLIVFISFITIAGIYEFVRLESAMAHQKAPSQVHMENHRHVLPGPAK